MLWAHCMQCGSAAGRGHPWNRGWAPTCLLMVWSTDVTRCSQPGQPWEDMWPQFYHRGSGGTRDCCWLPAHGAHGVVSAQKSRAWSHQWKSDVFSPDFLIRKWTSGCRNRPAQLWHYSPPHNKADNRSGTFLKVDLFIISCGMSLAKLKVGGSFSQVVTGIPWEN